MDVPKFLTQRSSLSENSERGYTVKTLVSALVLALAFTLFGSTVYNHTASAYTFNTCSAPSLQEASQIFGGELKYWSKLSPNTIQYQASWEKKLNFSVPNGFILGVPANGGRQFVPGDQFVGGYFYAICISSSGKKHLTNRPPATCPRSEDEAYRKIGGEKTWYYPSMFEGHFPPLIYQSSPADPIAFVVPKHSMVEMSHKLFLPGDLVVGYNIALTCYMRDHESHVAN